VAVAEHDGHEVGIYHDEQITLGDRINNSSIVATLSYRATVRYTRSKVEISGLCRVKIDALAAGSAYIGWIGGHEVIVVDALPGPLSRLPGECQ
jgi:hypothetical protein